MSRTGRDATSTGVNSDAFIRSRRRFLGVAAAGAAISTLPGCVTTNVATGRSSYTGTFSIDDDIRIGREEHPKLLKAFGGQYQNRQLQGYVYRIGTQLARGADYQQYPYQFTLLNSPIVNAFALPGGFVYLSRGLLAVASNEAEMAGVIAHELGHVNARHGAERRSAAQLAQFGVMAAALGASALGVSPGAAAQLGQGIAAMAIQGYSRQQEFEADKLGVRYMSRAGYEPDAMVTFLSTLREQSQVEAKSLGLAPGAVDEFNFMSTHPRTVDRVQAATRAADMQRPKHPRVGRNAYLSQIDGMLFGDDPSQGIVSGRRFSHRGLRLEFTVPQGYRLKNTSDQVVASSKDGAAILFDIAKTQQARDPLGYIQREWAPKAQLRLVSELQVSGRRAATALAGARTRNGESDVRMVAISRDASSVFRFMFVSPGKETKTQSSQYRKTTQSFRQLTPAEASQIRALRLLVVPARPGDTVEGLSKNLPYGSSNAEWFRVLNDLPANAQPKPNSRLKVVVS